MKINKVGSLILWSIVILAIFAQCRKEALMPTPEVPVDPPVTPSVIPPAKEVNTFVWSYMHDVYLWNDSVGNLTNTYYQPLTTSSPNYKRNLDSLNFFLNKFSDPNVLFNNVLYKKGVVDKWSFIQDYSVIVDWITGTSNSMGYDIRPYYMSSGSTDILEVVRYVIKDSPADLAGIQRGDIFTKVDGVQLTASNYQTLTSKATMTISLASLVNGAYQLTGKTSTMTAVKITEDPIFLNKVITSNGTKIGYLVYNGFISGNDPLIANDNSRKFDIELNGVFQKFKTDGVSKLILDLRYNGGGDVETAIYLASMIYTTNTTKLFTKSIFNAILTSYYTSKYGSSVFLDNFADKINSTTIGCLNLTDISFIVSDETASASELLINGLRPYMNVKLIGTTTYGKYVASSTYRDYDQNGVLVTTHNYALQPIVAKYANSLNVTGFVKGFTPDIEVKGIGNMLPLGDENETLLNIALGNLNKSLPLNLGNPINNLLAVPVSKLQNPFAFDMFIDQQKFQRRAK